MSAVQRESLISYDPLSSPTLGQVVDRVEAIVSAGIPLDTPLTRWYNPDALRDELTFEVGCPLAEMSVDDIYQRASVATVEDAEALEAEIRGRLKRLEEIEKQAKVVEGEIVGAVVRPAEVTGA